MLAALPRRLSTESMPPSVDRLDPLRLHEGSWCWLAGVELSSDGERLSDDERTDDGRRREPSVTAEERRARAFSHSSCSRCALSRMSKISSIRWSSLHLTPTSTSSSRSAAQMSFRVRARWIQTRVSCRSCSISAFSRTTSLAAEPLRLDQGRSAELLRPESSSCRMRTRRLNLTWPRTSGGRCAPAMIAGAGAGGAFGGALPGISFRNRCWRPWWVSRFARTGRSLGCRSQPMNIVGTVRP